jgi:hypothetical protein
MVHAEQAGLLGVALAIGAAIAGVLPIGRLLRVPPVESIGLKE